MHDIAVTVAQHLNLDVPRALDVFFGVDLRIAEGCLGLGRSRLNLPIDVRLPAHDAHAAPATACARLDEHWEPVTLGEFAYVCGTLDATGARHARHPGLLGKLHSGELVAHGFDRFSRGTYEGNALRTAQACELCTLR